MKRLPLPLWLLFRTNLIKTIILNFKLFPVSIAKKLPVVLIGKVNFSGSIGQITFTEPIYTGMVIIGELPDDINAFKRNTPTRFKVAGNLVLGSHIHIRGGGVFNVGKDGKMTIGSYTLINSYCRVWCTSVMNIGNNVRVSWESQLFDSNFHYLVDDEGYTHDCKGRVEIGDNVWIGNRCTLSKGTVLPNYCIVGSGSFVSKDFSEFGERTIIGGAPAKYIKSGYRRLFDRTKQIEIDQFFKENPDKKDCFVGNDIV